MQSTGVGPAGSGIPDDAEPDELEPVGVGTQGMVFGKEKWVVKVQRRSSLLGFLSRWVKRWSWAHEVRDSLGGIVDPLLLLDRVSFRAEKMFGRGKLHSFNRKNAIARERYPQSDFLDLRLSLAEPDEALRLVKELVATLERVRSRGFYMHDFIMKNFVVTADGELRIVDIDLISPMRAFWEPGIRLSAIGFCKGLAKDYQRLLGEVRGELEENDPLRGEIDAFSTQLPARLGRLRARKIPDLESKPPTPVQFDPELEKEIRATIGKVR